MDAIREKLKEVYDPELGINIVDLGLIYDIRVDDGVVQIVMTLTTPGCPMHTAIVNGVKRALEPMPEVKSVDVDVVWDPPWTPAHMSKEAKEFLGYF